jgi:hypothetical protein
MDQDYHTIANAHQGRHIKWDAFARDHLDYHRLNKELLVEIYARIR